METECCSGGKCKGAQMSVKQIVGCRAIAIMTCLQCLIVLTCYRLYTGFSSAAALFLLLGGKKGQFRNYSEEEWQILLCGSRGRNPKWRASSSKETCSTTSQHLSSLLLNFSANCFSDLLTKHDGHST
ncbi:hypothetical protein SDJN03_19221, partial [Cucurbita argyrosperma subsp. sororia]